MISNMLEGTLHLKGSVISNFDSKSHQPLGKKSIYETGDLGFVPASPLIWPWPWITSFFVWVGVSSSADEGTGYSDHSGPSTCRGPSSRKVLMWVAYVCHVACPDVLTQNFLCGNQSHLVISCLDFSPPSFGIICVTFLCCLCLLRARFRIICKLHQRTFTYYLPRVTSWAKWNSNAELAFWSPFSFLHVF